MDGLGRDVRFREIGVESWKYQIQIVGADDSSCEWQPCRYESAMERRIDCEQSWGKFERSESNVLDVLSHAIELHRNHSIPNTVR